MSHSPTRSGGSPSPSPSPARRSTFSSHQDRLTEGREGVARRLRVSGGDDGAGDEARRIRCRSATFSLDKDKAKQQMRNGNNGGDGDDDNGGDISASSSYAHFPSPSPSSFSPGKAKMARTTPSHSVDPTSESNNAQLIVAALQDARVGFEGEEKEGESEAGDGDESLSLSLGGPQSLDSNLPPSMESSMILETATGVSFSIDVAGEGEGHSGEWGAESGLGSGTWSARSSQANGSTLPQNTDSDDVFPPGEDSNLKQPEKRERESTPLMVDFHHYGSDSTSSPRTERSHMQ